MAPVKRSTSRVSADQRSQITAMTRCSKCCYYFRQFITFLFSHIGLCTLLLGYALVGAFTFQALEQKYEREQHQIVWERENHVIKDLIAMTNRLAVLRQDKWTNETEKILLDFEKFLYAAIKNGYDVRENGTYTGNSQWSFPGALLYSIIVITTIGYGNVAPRTDLGKIVTILYAIIGIPLMLFCLSNIGHTLAHSFKFIYWKCCCYLCVTSKKTERQRKMRRRTRKRRMRAMITRQAAFQRAQNHYHHLNHHNLNRSLEAVPQRLSRTSSDRSTSQNRTITGTQLPETPYTPSTPDSRGEFFEPVSSAPVDTDGKLLQLPRKTILARSLSARYHNESKKLAKPIVSSNNQKLAPVICNKYASCSEECIENFRKNSDEQEAQQLKSNSINRNVPNQVRFQATGLADGCSSLPPPSPFPPYPPTTTTSINRSISVFEPPSPNTFMAQLPPPFPSRHYEFIEMNNVPAISYDSKLMTYQQETMLLDDEITEPSESDSDTDDSDIQEKNIPFSVCLALVIGYICGGALFFSSWESWSFLDASYFCFITLSTIGFGDLVPGTVYGYGSTSEDGQMTLAICALYLLFGMALLAMSLNLVKEKVLEAVRIIGERIGILVNDDDDDDDADIDDDFY